MSLRIKIANLYKLCLCDTRSYASERFSLFDNVAVDKAVEVDRWSVHDAGICVHATGVPAAAE